MTQFFNRRVRAVVGKRGQPGIEIKTRISFDITKTNFTLANKGNLTFYNLSRESRDIFEQENLFCELYAGHEFNQSLIFVGQVVYIKPDMKSPDLVTNERSGQDILTKIECRDADFFYKAPVSVRAQKGEEKKTIIEQLIDALGLTKGTVTGLPTDKLKRGYSFEGSAPDFLTQKLQPHGSDWSVQDEILQVKPINEPVDKQAIVLESETGLYNNLQKRTQKTEKGFSIIEIQGSCLLNPLIKPAKLLRVKSRRFSKSGLPEDLGLWLTMEVKHRGDSYSGDYVTEFRAKKYA